MMRGKSDATTIIQSLSFDLVNIFPGINAKIKIKAKILINCTGQMWIFVTFALLTHNVISFGCD